MPERKKISQLSAALCEHIHAFKLLISLLTDVIVKYVLLHSKLGAEQMVKIQFKAICPLK